MCKAMRIARPIIFVLVLALLGSALSCGGGHRTSSLLPAPSASDHNTNSSQFDRSASVPISDISKLDPRVQALYSDPGWDQPITPQASGDAPPAPPELTVERLMADASGEPVERNLEPITGSKGASYLYRPPSDPNYFPAAGEYDATIYPGTPPQANPPWGSDASDDGDRLEDRIQRVDQFNKIARSFVWRGETIANQFNRGFAANNTLGAVYQTYRDVNQAWGEWSYPAAQTYQTVPLAAYDVAGTIYAKLQLKSKVKRYSQAENIAWYDILIAPLGNVGLEQEATGAPNQTKAVVQKYFYDSTAMPNGEAWMVGLKSSKEATITALIGTQTPTNPTATFPIFGILQKRWADDVWNIGLDEPWTGRLGWPLGDPFIDRNGRLLTGANGMYYRYGQYFEKGYMWLYDYVDPNKPDEVYIFIYDKNCTLISGGTYTQDPAVVKYGTGGPLGVVVFANPTTANVGDPIYFKAFPYGGPTSNANGFADDWFLWNFRDGTVTPSSLQYPIHEYYVEAKYTARLMFTIDANGDGNPDGTTAGYKVFADSPEVSIGHLGAGGGGGGSNPVLVVEDTGGTANATAVKTDLTAINVSFDAKTRGEISGASSLQPYKLVIWCSAPSSSQIDSTEETMLITYVQSNHGNLFIPYQYLYTNYNSAFYNMLGSTTSFWTWYQQYWVTAGTDYYGNSYVLGSGPGGSISQLNSNYLSPVTEGYYYYYYNGGATRTLCGEYGFTPYYAEGLARDNYTSGTGGIACWIGGNWDAFTGTTPSGPGRSGALKNLIQFIDPSIFTSGGGGGGGEPILPYDGPVDIADVFAYTYADSGAVISGGDGSDALHRAIVSITATGPKPISFDCQARSKSGVNLVYEWEFEPGAGYSVWTKYTAHYYAGAIDPDGPGGPAAVGDPFPVNVRVYNSSFGSYANAPTTDRDSDAVLVQVTGPQAVDIMDDGTVFQSGYQRDASQNVTVPIKFKIVNGAAPYDHVYVDYDYDFLTFQNRLEILPTPGEGSSTYDVVIPSATPGKTYYFAIRVEDADAPNLQDTYVWPNGVLVAAKILVIKDGVNATAHDNLMNSLNSFTNDYSVVGDTSGLTATYMEGFPVVIWEGNSDSWQGCISSTEKSVLKTFWDDGGRALMMLPYEYYYYVGGSYDEAWMIKYWGISWNYPTDYFYFWNNMDYWGDYYYNIPQGELASGPGGTVNEIDFQYYYYEYNYDMSYMTQGWVYYSTSTITNLMLDGFYGEYSRAWYRDIPDSTGRNLVWGQYWGADFYVGGTAGRDGMLRNLIEITNPDAF